MSRRFALAAALVATFLVPAAASAVTVDEIVALARAGVTDTVILALIDRDKTIFSLSPDELVSLEAEGVSEPVIVAMLKSGREEGERAAQAAADLNAAMILAERGVPEVAVVGRGPDEPNAGSPRGFYSAASGGGYIALPYVVDGGRRRGRNIAPVSPAFTSSFGSPIQPSIPPIGAVVPPVGAVVPPVAPRRTEPPAPRALCRAEVSSATSARPLTFVTECPPAMQPARRR